MTEKKERLVYAVWNTATGQDWTFGGYGRTDSSGAADTEHQRLILIRIPELIGVKPEDWDYNYSIRR